MFDTSANDLNRRDVLRKGRGFYSCQNRQEIVARIEYDLPDGLVITGDLARRNGRIEAYDNLRGLLAPISRKRPVCLGLGNHDDRGDFFQAFAGTVAGDRPVQNRHIVMVDAGPVRFVVLDTIYFVNMMPGLLGRSQRAWRAALLRVCDEGHGGGVRTLPQVRVLPVQRDLPDQSAGCGIQLLKKATCRLGRGAVHPSRHRWQSAVCRTYGETPQARVMRCLRTACCQVSIGRYNLYEHVWFGVFGWVHMFPDPYEMGG